MSKSKFVLHAWEKEKLDALVLENAKIYGEKYGRIEGQKKGRISGIKEGTIKIAKNLLNMNMSIHDISKATGLSIKELKLLNKNSVGN